ncbi:MAG: DNRLRE domain-containing protein [Methanobacteriota archaeon]
MPSRSRTVAWVFVALALVSVSAFSVVTALNSPPRTFFARVAGDTTLSTFNADDPQGRETTLTVSRSGGELNWSLIQFNLNGQLRPGDLIKEARVQFHVVSASGADFPATIVTGRLLTSWSENTASFETKPLMAFDTRTATLVRELPEPGAGIWIDVSKQLMRWHSYGGPSNFGTVLQIASDVDDATLSFASKENAQYTGPRMQVQYSPGPPSLYGYVLESGILEAAAARFD